MMGWRASIGGSRERCAVLRLRLGGALRRLLRLAGLFLSAGHVLECFPDGRSDLEDFFLDVFRGTLHAASDLVKVEARTGIGFGPSG